MLTGFAQNQINPLAINTSYNQAAVVLKECNRCCMGRRLTGHKIWMKDGRYQCCSSYRSLRHCIDRLPVTAQVTSLLYRWGRLTTPYVQYAQCGYTRKHCCRWEKKLSNPTKRPAITWFSKLATLNKYIFHRTTGISAALQ